ncbi:hypothetical protein TeGR_g13915 [Tetraparma gracilis]|uniref:Xaa-Pro dipeptidyl-peptidase C-terminal domain-containing protein n=1 Tax=Tetraparma gracilis TaxID=2962635 RepID=A0ABQ6MPE7_9STRA|nr:hypothetical protein TeGR_g13915 [Tetraparma gracilis]
MHMFIFFLLAALLAVSSAADISATNELMEYETVEDLMSSPNAELALAARERRVHDEWLQMKDGRRLWTRVVLPRGASFDDPTANVTAVIDRSPYGYWSLEVIASVYLGQGFAAVGQDMRGTKRSGGSFTIWHSDADDGEVTLDWLAEQPWSSGSVLSFGASADGLASYTLLDTAPEPLDAQFIIWSSSQGYPIIFPGGAYRQSLADTWMQDTVRPYDADNCIAELKTNEAPNPEWWEPLNMTVANDDYEVVRWPSLHWAGWFDIFLVGQLIAFDGYKNHAAPGNDNDVKIFIDPLGHCQAAADEFPRHTIAGRSALPLLMSFELYKSTQTGKPFGNATDDFMKYRDDIKDVTFYVLGANEDTAAGNYWTTLDSFPDFTPTKFMLDAGGKLNKSEEPAAETEPVSYAHDPADPVPSIGGSNLFLPCGPLDQAPNKDREDMLWFETEPLEENFVITGPMMANLKVGSDAVDTDFMVKIMDKYETGEYKLLQEGAVRMRNNIFEDMEADRTYEMQLDMWNTSYVFSPGHSIAVSVASSNYPRFSNNFNNGKTLIDETLEEDAEVATNTIMPGSYVELPVVSLRDLPRTRVIEEINELYEEHAMMGVMLAESLAKK